MGVMLFKVSTSVWVSYSGSLPSTPVPSFTWVWDTSMRMGVTDVIGILFHQLPDAELIQKLAEHAI